MTTSHPNPAPQNIPNKSTGPKTDRGKKRSSQNALKHGLTSAQMIGPDEIATYEYYCRSLIEEYDLTTFTEIILAERCANCYVRLQRGNLAENQLFERAKIKNRLHAPEMEELQLPTRLMRKYTVNSLAGVYDLRHQTNAERLAEIYNMQSEVFSCLARGVKTLNGIEEHSETVFQRLEHLAELAGMNIGCLFKGENDQQSLAAAVMLADITSLPSEVLAYASCEPVKFTPYKSQIEGFLEMLSEEIAAELGCFSIDVKLNKIRELNERCTLPDITELDSLSRYNNSLNNQFSKALGELRQVVKERRESEVKEEAINQAEPRSRRRQG